MTLQTNINGHSFVLHCSGALYWAERRMLLIADAHLGKISHFRKFGAALPDNALFSNFRKLDAAVDFFSPESICFLGDLFHSTLNNEWQLFAEWAERTGIPIILIAGNHDIIAPQQYHNINITVVSEWVTGGFLLTHHPEEREGLFTLSGHIHPAVRLMGMGRQSMKLPCFFRTQHQMILPAFGEFTGTYVMEMQENDIAYAIIKDDVVQINARPRVHAK
ncbi:metallophosphoesterase [Flavobacterium akiainvivens]|uniref:Metallophosphoesterase n=1 Tax=Flavobacterium akiainvivens TaxID=1202724 RepID=A0A0M9VJ29_9FLAO|nr:ligase-associated DNA damage response endonuclease PdeM [Flavobacterium akiainvivens]KOS07269.1 metallophosphoesterase [Flavobacterium akiainvivens]SFQ45966.1 putative phosphoesterase [Flavobacterium akiainvivens]